MQATLSDKRRSVCNEELGIAYFEAEVLTQTDYYPFGSVMPDRQWSAGAEGYRYGFNGMERDDDTYGKGNALDFGARIYDSRLGRWLSVVELNKDYLSLTPYHFGLNIPTCYKDEDGVYLVDGNGKKVIVKFGDNETLILPKNTTIDVIELLSAMWNSSPNGKDAVKKMVMSRSEIEVIVHETIGLIANNDNPGKYIVIARLANPTIEQECTLIEESKLLTGKKGGKVYKKNTLHVFSGTYEYLAGDMAINSNNVVIFNPETMNFEEPSTPIDAAMVTNGNTELGQKYVSQIIPKDRDDFLHLIGVHEAHHLTSKNIKLQLKKRADSETPARKVEKRAHKNTYPQREDKVIQEE